MERLTSFTTNPFFGLAGSLMSTAATSSAAYGEAMAQNYAKRWNARQAEYGAEIALAKAANFRKLGETEKFETLQQFDALRSRQRAEYSAAGVDVNVGSALETQKQTMRLGVYEAQKAKYERDLQAWELTMEARDLQMTAAMNKSSLRNPWIPATTALAGGLTSIYDTFGKWKPGSGTSKSSQTSSTFTGRSDYGSVPGMAP